MDNRQPKVILFDIDGTLILSGGAGGAALNFACEEVLGIAQAMSVVKPGGMTDPAIVRQIYREFLNRQPAADETHRVLSRYLAYLPRTLAASTSFRILPGFPAILDALHERSDTLVGLGTGNLSEGARIKLEFADLFHYFSFGGFGSDAEDRVELIRCGIERGMEMSDRPVAPENVFVIGDTVRDVECGRQAGARTIAVATGMTSRDDLAQRSPDFLFDDFSDPAAFLALF